MLYEKSLYSGTSFSIVPYNLQLRQNFRLTLKKSRNIITNERVAIFCVNPVYELVFLFI